MIEYIFFKGTITVANTTASAAGANSVNQKVMFKNCVPFTNSMSRINTAKVDDVYDLDVVMSMYNVIEYSVNYTKTSGILWQCCRDQPALATNGDITDFNKGN